MIPRSYKVRYRQPGQIFWRTILNVTGDGVEGTFRFFLTREDDYICISIGAEVWFPPERNLAVIEAMSKEAGFNIQRA
jgi:hypothetical protein